MFRNSTILVTGGSGFIGSNLCNQLLHLGNKVINIDNFNNFYNPQIKRQNVQEALINPLYTLYEVDIRDEQAINDVFNNHSIDLVIHLAGMAGVRPSIDNPNLYIEVNVQGTINLLNAAQRKGVKKFIFASSSSVYGDRHQIEPLLEDMPIHQMISPYAISKKNGEDLCYYFHHQYNMDIIVLRFFTVFGPGQRPDLAIHKFVRLICANEYIPMFGEGDTLRDYTYIDDIIKGVIAAANLVTQNSKLFEIINLSGQQAISLREMIAEIELALGKKAKIAKQPMQPGDVFFTQADLTKAQKLLNYFPQTPFKEGIRHFINWYNLSTHAKTIQAATH